MQCNDVQDLNRKIKNIYNVSKPIDECDTYISEHYMQYITDVKAKLKTLYDNISNINISNPDNYSVIEELNDKVTTLHRSCSKFDINPNNLSPNQLSKNSSQILPDDASSAE